MKNELQRAIAAGEVEIVEDGEDLDKEPITLSDGTVLNNAAGEKLGRDVADRALARRRGQA